MINKNIVTLIISLLLVNCLSAQRVDFSIVDNHAKSVPSQYLISTTEIANYLTKPFDSDREKVRAIFFWVANNFKYDLSGKANRFNLEDRAVEYILKSGKGVCQNFTELTNELCQKAGIKSVVIAGYTKQMGKVVLIAHAWNGVYIDNKWLLIDATWASGRSVNGKYFNKFEDKYFLDPPKKFLVDHMPFDPIWQFSDKIISHKEFYKNIVESSVNFNSTSEIARFFSVNECVQMEESIKRIVRCGVENRLIESELTLLRENVEVCYYNSAVEYFNNAVNYYNNWVELFNKDNQEDDQREQLKKLAFQEAEKALGILTNINSVNSARNITVRSMIKDLTTLQKTISE